MSDLELAYDALSGKKADYDLYWRYYDGDHPVVYAASRLREIFNNLDVKFNENWCEVVIGAELERINLRGLRVLTDNQAAQEALDAVWAANQMPLEADDIAEGALVTGEAFLMVWPGTAEATAGDAEPAGAAARISSARMVTARPGPMAYYNDPRLCHVFYDTENPRRKRAAAKWWRDDDGYVKLTLYYSDRIEYYRSQQKTDAALSAKSFALFGEPAVNPYGEIPVFHFKTKRTPKSDLKNVVPMQDVINKLLSNMIVAAEYGAFRQRYIISNVEVKGKLRNAPNEIWDLPAGDGVGQPTQVGEFSATDLRNYLDAIENMAGSLSAITRIPKHYFIRQSGDPSGEALIAMEAPLSKKVADRIERFTPEWRAAGSFMLRLAGFDVPPEQIDPVYEPAQSVLPRTMAEVRQLSVQAGMPLVVALKREGWSEQQLAELQEAQAADPDWQLKVRNVGLLGAQLGVSQDTLLEEAGFSPQTERRRREEAGDAVTGTDAADRLLTALERR